MENHIERNILVKYHFELYLNDIYKYLIKDRSYQHMDSIEFYKYLDFYPLYFSIRFFAFLDKSKLGKIEKNVFIDGLSTLFYGQDSDKNRLIFEIIDSDEDSILSKDEVSITLSHIFHNKIQKVEKNILKIFKNLENLKFSYYMLKIKTNEFKIFEKIKKFLLKNKPFDENLLVISFNDENSNQKIIEKIIKNKKLIEIDEEENDDIGYLNTMTDDISTSTTNLNVVAKINLCHLKQGLTLHPF